MPSTKYKKRIGELAHKFKGFIENIKSNMASLQQDNSKYSSYVQLKKCLEKYVLQHRMLEKIKICDLDMIEQALNASDPDQAMRVIRSRNKEILSQKLKRNSCHSQKLSSSGPDTSAIVSAASQVNNQSWVLPGLFYYDGTFADIPGCDPENDQEMNNIGEVPLSMNPDTSVIVSAASQVNGNQSWISPGLCYEAFDRIPGC